MSHNRGARICPVTPPPPPTGSSGRADQSSASPRSDTVNTEQSNTALQSRSTRRQSTVRQRAGVHRAQMVTGTGRAGTGTGTGGGGAPSASPPPLNDIGAAPCRYHSCVSPVCGWNSREETSCCVCVEWGRVGMSDSVRDSSSDSVWSDSAVNCERPPSVTWRDHLFWRSPMPGRCVRLTDISEDHTTGGCS